MSQTDVAHAWWSRLRHQGLLLSPVVLLERYPTAPPEANFYAKNRLREAHTRFSATQEEGGEADPAKILSFVDSLLENFIGHSAERLAKQHSIPEKFTVPVRIGSKTETVRPHRILFADDASGTPALLVMADSSPQVGRGRGRTKYAHLLELLRGTGHRLGLLTNGQQFRLVYAGLDFESWCEWESDRWFDDGEGTEELLGLRQLLSPESLKPIKEGVSGLLDGIEESRKRQADLSSVLRENVRQAVEHLLDEVSTANRTNADLFKSLIQHDGSRTLTDTEAHEALMQATVRVVMRLVVCLFAESRQLLPVNDPIYTHSYGVRTLYELLDEATRNEGGTHVLLNRETAWPRMMALFRLIHGGSSHGSFPLRPYGGVLFRPGDESSSDAVARALHILEHDVKVADATIYYVLRKLLRGPLPVIKGRSKTFVEGPVDYTDLRTEFIGLIYEGLLDYRVKRTDEQIGPQVFLNLGREPVLPLSRLTDMLTNDKKGLKDLLTTLRKEKVTATAAEEKEEAEEDAEDATEEEDSPEEIVLEGDNAEDVKKTGDYLDAYESAMVWAREAVALAGLVKKQGKKETDSEFQARTESEAKKLIKRVVATGEFYLVRAGNTRKGTGTFYTRPQLAVPTTHRTLQPLCYDKDEGGRLVPKTPEVILALKVCDPACGSASFLVAALHYLTDALYRSLCHHKKLDDHIQAKKVTLPFGRPRSNDEADQLVPFPPNDRERGHLFEDRIKALLRRHIVERCIYGVDINPLAVEFARVSLWVETLDPELPFSFLDHKIKVGNSLVGCWLDRVEDYPLRAWEREGGDGKDGPHSKRLLDLLVGPLEHTANKKGDAKLKRSGDGRIKQEMRWLIEGKFGGTRPLFSDPRMTVTSVVANARAEYENLHALPLSDPDEREQYYRDHVLNSPAAFALKAAMDEWCALWFWPTDEKQLQHAPTPTSFHSRSNAKDEIVAGLAGTLRFFHWEVEYPDVFTQSREGFDAIVGNPPWDVMKPHSQEFFTDFEPLYRTYDKQTAIKKQKELLEALPYVASQWERYNAYFKGLSNWVRSVAEPFDCTLGTRKDNERLLQLWAQYRREHGERADGFHPFRLQGGSDLNSYKLFTEHVWTLLRADGRLGFILPTGIYSDLGTKSLREELLNRGQLELLYAIQNEKRIFTAADHTLRLVVLIAAKGRITNSFLARFRMGVSDSPRSHEIPDDILRDTIHAMRVTPLDVRTSSPRTLGLLELRTPKDLDVIRRIDANSYRIGDADAGWKISYARELDMTDDSHLFAPRESWEAKGFRPDVFGRWIGPNGEMALPVYEGRMIGQFDVSQKGWVSGKGRKAVWRPLAFDSKAIEPQFLISREKADRLSGTKSLLKTAFMDVTRATVTRTMHATVHHQLPFGNSTPTLTIANDSGDKSLLLAAVLNSLCFDYSVRQRLAGLHLNWFVLEECVLPKGLVNGNKSSEILSRIASSVCRLTFVHRRFAAEWLKLREMYPCFKKREWKHCWAVTEADRLRLRVEIDAYCADLYGLDSPDFDWIARDDTTDPKGFYRVDRHLPYRERLTGLASAAFRALREGKWSAGSAAELSNDEFFELLGIPELTNLSAAQAMGLPSALISKRDGCHNWHPEAFLENDFRYGWTWQDCWDDAAILLGSEDAVNSFLAGNRNSTRSTAEVEAIGSKESLEGPIPGKSRQMKMF